MSDRQDDPIQRVIVRTPAGPSECGFWAPAPGAPPGGCLLLPGFWGDWDRRAYLALALVLSRRGAVLAANLRGHRGSPGLFTFGRKEPGDVESLYEELARRSPGPVTALGFSMGGWTLAARLAADPALRHATRRLVLASVPYRLPWVLPRPWRPGLALQLLLGGRGLVRPSPLGLWPPRDLLSCCAALDGLETVIVHATHDFMVHHRHALKLYGALPRGKRCLVLVQDWRGPHAEMLALLHRETVANAVTAPLEEVSNVTDRGQLFGP